MKPTVNFKNTGEQNTHPTHMSQSHLTHTSQSHPTCITTSTNLHAASQSRLTGIEMNETYYVSCKNEVSRLFKHQDPVEVNQLDF